jgi:hypothetical protein
MAIGMEIEETAGVETEKEDIEADTEKEIEGGRHREGTKHRGQINKPIIP